MVKKAAALFLVCASVFMWVSCNSTSSRFLYGAIPGTSQIVAYREDPNSGILTQLVGSPITAGPSVESIVIHPSNKFLYAANSGEDNVSLFTISTTGTLAEAPPRTPVGTGPTVLAMDAAGTFLYVGNSGSNSISAFSIDATHGTLTLVKQGSGQVAPIGITPINMQVSPSGGVLYVTGPSNGVGLSGVIEAFTLNQGVLTALAPTSFFFTGTNPYGLAITAGSNGDFLYTANNTDDSISEFAINADDSLSQLANSPFGVQYLGPIALQLDQSGKFMFVANQGSSFITGYSVGTNGALTLLTTSPFASAANPSVMASDPGGDYLFVGNQKTSVIQSFQMNTSTGALTSVNTYPLPAEPTSFAVTSKP